MYSLLEQHVDGSWWYHPGDTFDTEAEVEQQFKETFGNFAPDRPHMAFEHTEPMYQEFATCTFDFKTFHFGGIILWPKSLKETINPVNPDSRTSAWEQIPYSSGCHDCPHWQDGADGPQCEYPDSPPCNERLNQ